MMMRAPRPSLQVLEWSSTVVAAGSTLQWWRRWCLVAPWSWPWPPACGATTLHSVAVALVASEALSRVSHGSPAGLWVTVTFAHLFLVGELSCSWVPIIKLQPRLLELVAKLVVQLGLGWKLVWLQHPRCWLWGSKKPR
jgi:hypothetical protein